MDQYRRAHLENRIGHILDGKIAVIKIHGIPAQASGLSNLLQNAIGMFRWVIPVQIPAFKKSAPVEPPVNNGTRIPGAWPVMEMLSSADIELDQDFNTGYLLREMVNMKFVSYEHFSVRDGVLYLKIDNPTPLGFVIKVSIKCSKRIT